MRKWRLTKRIVCLGLVFLLNINAIAAIVSDNDGSAFITKAEFDSLKNNFQAQIDQYNTSIDSKIDGAIAQYLSGIKITSDEIVLELLYDDLTSTENPFITDLETARSSTTLIPSVTGWTPYIQNVKSGLLFFCYVNTAGIWTPYACQTEDRVTNKSYWVAERAFGTHITWNGPPNNNPALMETTYCVSYGSDLIRPDRTGLMAKTPVFYKSGHDPAYTSADTPYVPTVADFDYVINQMKANYSSHVSDLASPYWSGRNYAGVSASVDASAFTYLKEKGQVDIEFVWQIFNASQDKREPVYQLPLKIGFALADSAFSSPRMLTTTTVNPQVDETGADYVGYDKFLKFKISFYNDTADTWLWVVWDIDYTTYTSRPYAYTVYPAACGHVYTVAPYGYGILNPDGDIVPTKVAYKYCVKADVNKRYSDITSTETIIS